MPMGGPGGMPNLGNLLSGFMGPGGAQGSARVNIQMGPGVGPDIQNILGGLMGPPPGG